MGMLINILFMLETKNTWYGYLETLIQCLQRQENLYWEITLK